jgi:hypothetical protein
MSVSLYGSGQTVLQVVQTVVTSAFTYSGANATWYDVTGWTATITPNSTNSKILVSYSGCFSVATSGNYGSLTKIQRNGSDIGVGASRGSTTQATCSILAQTPNYGFLHQASYLDSPSSTSALTYKIQGWTEAGAGNTIVGGSYNTANAYNASTPYIITLMEISGA